MDVLLDPYARYRDRMAVLESNPHLVEEGVRKLLERWPGDEDYFSTTLVHEAALTLRLSMPLVMEIISRFKASLKKVVAQLLYLNIYNAINSPSHLPEFVLEYFDTDLSLDTLKTSLVAALTKEHWDRSPECPHFLNLFKQPLYQKLVDGNEAKAQDLRVHMMKYILELLGHTYDGERMAQDYFDHVFDIEVDTTHLRVYIAHIRAMTPYARGVAAHGIICYLHPLQERFIDEEIDLSEIVYLSVFRPGEEETGNFIDDPQNVHRIRIESDVLVELDTLDAKYKERDDSMEELYEKPELTASLKRIDTDPSDFHRRTLKEWLRIVFLWCKDEGHLPILEQELKDMSGMCSSGHFRRLINVMNGFLFHLEESNHDALKAEFFTRVNTLIQAQPNADEIVADLSTRGIEYADVVTKEMARARPWDDWFTVFRAKHMYLYGE